MLGLKMSADCNQWAAYRIATDQSSFCQLNQRLHNEVASCEPGLVTSRIILCCKQAGVSGGSKVDAAHQQSSQTVASVASVWQPPVSHLNNLCI
jgi:hypothetical protein